MSKTITLARHRRRAFSNLKDCIFYAQTISKHTDEPHYVIQVNTFWEAFFVITQCKGFDFEQGGWPENSLIRAIVVGEEFSYE